MKTLVVAVHPSFVLHHSLEVDTTSSEIIYFRSPAVGTNIYQQRSQSQSSEWCSHWARLHEKARPRGELAKLSSANERSQPKTGAPYYRL